MNKPIINNKKKIGWWIKILTNQPIYIYYFGAFKQYPKAEYLRNKCTEDLQKENRIDIIEIKKYQNIKLDIKNHKKNKEIKGIIILTFPVKSENNYRVGFSRSHLLSISLFK